MNVEITFRENGIKKITEISYHISESGLDFEARINGEIVNNRLVQYHNDSSTDIFRMFDLLGNIHSLTFLVRSELTKVQGVEIESIERNYTTLKARIRLFLRSDLVNVKCYRHFESPVISYRTFKNIKYKDEQPFPDANAIYLNEELHRVYGSFYFAPNELFLT